MTPIVILLLVVVAVVLIRLALHYRAKAAASSDLRAVTKAADEDVTCLGEEIAELDLVTAGRSLDESGREDYQRALDEYDRAKEALAAVRRPYDVRAVTAALEDGRYAAACVRARTEGRPQPERRPPCFFNPQHGPSVEDVSWTPPSGVPRQVPICSADAARLRAGTEPDVRRVGAGRRRRPYWEAGPAYGPYAQGYFTTYANTGLLPVVLISGAMVSGASAGAGPDSWGDYGGGGDYHGGGDHGGWGGGDFGGGFGDFGGGGDGGGGGG